MNFFRFEASQRLAIPLERAWEFFSDPANLAAITPPALGLVVRHPVTERMHPGMILTYRVRPLLGIPMDWVTEITHVAERECFVDEQRFGPYRFWHHLHGFRAVPGGVEVRDVVHYKLSLGPLSGILDRLVVRREIEAIFRYRARVLAERFGELAGRGLGEPGTRPAPGRGASAESVPRGEAGAGPPPVTSA